MNQPISSAPTLRDRPVLILGNGPSAKLADFEQLRTGAIDSIGMNAAYRHWDRIDFRPTYYICMDTVVIKSHAPRIAELIREGRITRFFLRNGFLELFPEFAGHASVVWFDELRARKGSIFDTNWITTGSWSIRWAAHLGYRIAALIGIDANYVELLPEAERVSGDSGLQLELKRTPRFNPNYFFADYQQAGDRYNVPNDPGYQQKTGGLVHVDALRKAVEDIDRLGLPLRVVDGSPISTHAVFPKMDLARLFSARRMALVTSFFTAAPADEVANNARIAVANAGNEDIAAVQVLLEGSRAELLAKAGMDIAAEWVRLESAGRICITSIDRRPHYHQMFLAAQGTGQEVCAVANSDILLTAAFTHAMLADYARTTRPFLAFTRWNRTPNGLFIQGQVGHPPWQEVELDNLDFRQRNFLSFDLYCFDRRALIPEDLADVSIGTFGCDTAIAAIMRIAGHAVVNPCLTHRVEHVDEKVRNYASEVGQAQMLANTGAGQRALLARFAALPSMRSSLDEIDRLRPSLASIGTPVHRLGRWHSILRMLGMSPWQRDMASAIRFCKVELDVEDTRTRPEQVIQTLSAVLDAGDFLELEMGGHNGDHYLGCFGRTPELRHLRERLFRYDWQCVVYVDCVDDEERRIHADVVLTVRQCLTLGTGALSAMAGSAGYLAPAAATGRLPQRRSAREPAAGVLAPRVLVIDPTPIGHTSATGQIKAQFLRDHPLDRVMQVWEQTGPEGGLALFRPGSEREPSPLLVEADAARQACEAFAPDVVYCRPTDSVRLLEFSVRLMAYRPRPLVLHIMDDWPERARRTEAALHQRLDFLLRRLLSQTAVRLSISDPMSTAFAKRYGGDWTALANGVDVEAWPVKDWAARPPVSQAHPFIVRYLGGFAADMGADSITDVARAVSALQPTLPIRFEIFTMPWYLKSARAELGSLPGVRVEGLVDASGYPQALAAADALLVAYNFEESSLAYCGLSMGNKVPECLASGVPVLAYGPREAATISVLAECGGAEVVTQRDEGLLSKVLQRLVTERSHAQRLGTLGRAWVAERRTARMARNKFAEALRIATSVPLQAPNPPHVYLVPSAGVALSSSSAQSDSWRVGLHIFPGEEGMELVCLVQTSGFGNISCYPKFTWESSFGTIINSTSIASADGRWILNRAKVPAAGGEVSISHQDPETAWDTEVLIAALLRVHSNSRQIAVADANRVWRNEGPAAALPTYLALFAERPLPTYARNAVMCARMAAAQLSGSTGSLSSSNIP